MRHKGIPKIETLKATKRLPQRYKIRWDRGRKSFTDTDKAEVLRFATDLVAGDYTDPRDHGNLYGKKARHANHTAAGGPSEDRSFRAVAERYINALDGSPGYLRKYREELRNHAYPVIGDRHIDQIRVERPSKTAAPPPTR